MKIPAGTTLYIGPPAKPMPLERREDIRRALTGIPGIVEAHLPQCYAKGLFDPSAQVLVLVLGVEAVESTIIPTLRGRLRSVLPQGAFLDILPLPEGAPALQSVRAAGCKLNLSEV
jgi:hypothetical protein